MISLPENIKRKVTHHTLKNPLFLWKKKNPTFTNEKCVTIYNICGSTGSYILPFKNVKENQAILDRLPLIILKLGIPYRQRRSNLVQKKTKPIHAYLKCKTKNLLRQVETIIVNEHSSLVNGIKLPLKLHSPKKISEQSLHCSNTSCQKNVIIFAVLDCDCQRMNSKIINVVQLQP